MRNEIRSGLYTQLPMIFYAHKPTISFFYKYLLQYPTFFFLQQYMQKENRVNIRFCRDSIKLFIATYDKNIYLKNEILYKKQVANII